MHIDRVRVFPRYWSHPVRCHSSLTTLGSQFFLRISVLLSSEHPQEVNFVNKEGRRSSLSLEGHHQAREDQQLAVPPPQKRATSHWTHRLTYHRYLAAELPYKSSRHKQIRTHPLVFPYKGEPVPVPPHPPEQWITKSRPSAAGSRIPKQVQYRPSTVKPQGKSASCRESQACILGLLKQKPLQGSLPAFLLNFRHAEHSRGKTKPADSSPVVYLHHARCTFPFFHAQTPGLHREAPTSTAFVV